MQHLTIECGQTCILLFVKNIGNSVYQSHKCLGTNCINLLTLPKKDIVIVVLQVPAGTGGCRHHCCFFVTLRIKAVLSLYKLNVDKRDRLVFRKAADKNLLPASIVKDFCMDHCKPCHHR